MKIKNLSAGMKFLIIAVIVVAIAAAVFGVSDIFAEPTIEDLAAPYVHEIGTFKPDSVYGEKGKEVKLVGWLNTTQIMFSHDWWKDTSGDGKIDLEDVYSQEGFEKEMLMENMLYPIFESDVNGNYYVVAFPDYSDYNSVVIELRVAENNDNANLKNENQYWFDREHNHLYLSKAMLAEAVKNNEFTTLRSETIMLVKDIEEATKDIDIMTLFDASIKDTHGLQNSTVNEVRSMNMNEWLISGLRYQLVQPQDLAYISRDNLTVYVNGDEYVAWAYDETSGQITIDCTPYSTRSVAVKINKINEVSQSQQTLQWIQASKHSTVGQATTLEEALTADNSFLKIVQYDDVAPIIGTSQQLGFAGYAVVNKNGTLKDCWSVYTGTSESFSSKSIKQVLEGVLMQQIKDGKTTSGHFNSTTLSAFQTDINQGASIKDANGKVVERYKFIGSYGQVLSNLMLSKHSNEIANDKNTYLTAAVNAAQKYLLSSVNNTSESKNHGWTNTALTTTWNTWNEWGLDGRYLVGTWITESFLGGSINPNDGHAVFDVTCAQIDVSQISVSSLEKIQAMGALKNNDDFNTNVTIVGKTEPDASGNGYLYLCVWSRTIDPDASHNDKNSEGKLNHHQRVLAFSRVPYHYNGTGELIFAKTDANGQYIAGATYEIYNNPTCTGSKIASFTTSDTGASTVTLQQGTYYIKETHAPAGYIPQGIIGPLEIAGGQSVTIKAEEPVQEYKFDLIVYDQTTEKEPLKHKVPVNGIQFQIFAPGSDAPYTDANHADGVFVTGEDYNGNGKLDDSEKGRISFSVPAIGEYRLRQISTVTNYCMENNPDSKYYCEDVACACGGEYCTKTDENGSYNKVPAYPTDSQDHIKGHTVVHYEQRPQVAIKSHVQDINLLDETPATLGGDTDSGSLTTVEKSKYSLHTKTDILLGYYKGNPVIIKAGERLTIADGTGLKLETVSAIKRSNGKAYIEASHVWAKVKDGETVQWLKFPLPNGVYEWKLVEVQSGYYNNGATTEVDASWDKWNKNTPYNKNIEIVDRPVLQTRQTVSLTLYAKSYVNRYTEPDEMFEHDGYPIRTNAYTVFVEDTKSAFESTENIPTWMKPIDRQWTKTITSNTSTVTGTSIETATLYKNGNAILSVKTSGLVPNSIYMLVNLGDIVDVNTGDVIPAGTELGYHITDENGCVIINKLGSELIENPNKETSKEEYVDPVNLDGALPNGVYTLILKVAADGHELELMSNDIVFDVIWRQVLAQHDKIEEDAISLIHKVPPHDDPKLKIPVAPEPIPDDPDAPGGLNDPYDPDHPDPGDPDDSKDIPKVDIDWVNKNKNNIAYRVVDSDNLTDAGLNEVTDKLPTTFAFYLGNNLIVDGEYEFTHKLSFYYEIDKDEYDRVISAVGYDKASREVLKHGQVYLRRFEYGEFSGGELLTDNIVINELSDGYVLGHGYDRINENATLSAAIYNDEWLNEKLSQKEDGTYRIYVIVDSSVTYKIPFSGEIVTQHFTSFSFGVLTIKSRELTPLD